MDSARFDRIARAMGRRGGRRSLLAMAAALALPAGASAKKKKKCPRGETACRLCDGPRYCTDLQADPGNCGACGFGCPLNERCEAGRCVCGDSGISAAPYTCCPGGLGSICRDANLGGAVLPTTCGVAASCPTGWIVCTGDQGTADPLDSCKACCPPLTECNTSGGYCTYPSGPLFPSDGRLKEAVRPLSGGMETVAALRPVSWAWTAESGLGPGRAVGLIAQEVRDVVPEAVRTLPGGMLGVEYGKLVPALVAAVQEQQARIAGLEAEVAALRAREG